MDIATLGVNIKYDSVKQAGVALDKFSQSGEAAQKVTDKFGNALTQADQKLGRFIDAHGRMREANGRYVAGLAKATNETNSLSGATDKLRGLLQLLAFGTVATQAIKVADAYTQMQSKLRLVTQSTQELLAVQSQLNKVAVATFAEQSAVTELYAKMQPSLAALGKTTQDTVKFVETFNKALALTNPNAQQAQAAILQFSQAMGSGVLRGDEFNSMMENANGVMQKLAQGMGLPIGALREMAHEGKLTADVVYAALNNATESINSDFDKMALTVSNASQTIETGMFNLVGAINNATGATSSLAEVMHDFGQVLNLAANYVDIYAQASAEAEAKTKGMSGILDTASQSATNLHDIFRQVASVAYDVGTGIDMIVLGLGGLVATMASVGDSKQMQIVLQDTRKELDMIIKRNSDFKESLNIKSQTAQTVAGLKSIDEELKDIFGSSYEAEKATIKFTGSNKESEKAAKAHAKALKEQAKAHLEAIEALDKQVKAISKAEQAFRKYLNGSDFTSQVDELNEVTKAWKVLADNGLATTEDLQKAIDAVTMERFGTESQKAAEKMVENIDYAAEAMKVSIRRLDDAFADVWVDILNGAEDFGSSLKRWFTSLLAELAHAAITKPIVISMTGAMGMGGSGGAMASSIGSSAAGSYIGSALGGIGAGLGAFGAGATATLSSWGSAVGLTSATSQAGMLAAQTGAFGAQGAALTGQAMAGAGSSIMSTIGAAAPYAAAFLALDAVLGGNITSGIATGITGGSYELKHVTAKLTAVGDTIDSSILKIERKDGGWGNKSKTRKTELGTAELDQAMQDMYSAVYDSVAENATRLGFTVAENFTASVEMSVKGKSSEEIMQTFNEMFMQIGDKLVASAPGLSEALAPFQQQGETSYQTLSRLTAQFDAFNYPIGRLNDTLTTLNMTTLGAVDALVSMAGGMQNLQAMQFSFINAFYTDSQKAELTAQTVNSIFESIGMSAPASREALVAMVQALDLTTEAGQKAYIAITGATATLDTFFNNIERQAQEAARVAEQQAQEANRVYENALNNLSRAVNAEKDRLQDTLNDEIKSLQDAHNDRVRLLQNEADTISRNLSKLKSFQSSLKSIVDTLMPKYSGTTALRDATADIMGYVASGVIPEQEAVQSALDTINAQDKTYYSTYEEYVLDQARANVAANELLTLIDSGIANQETTLQTVTDQIENEGLALAQAMAKAQATYELELARLDSILESYGILNNSVLSVRDAVQALEGALSGALASAKAASAPTSNPYVGSVPTNAAPGVNSAYAHPGGVNVSSSDSATLAAAKLVYQSATGGVSTAQFNSAAAAVGGDIYAATGWNGDPASFRAMWGFANGGYTGNMATDAIAGVVHGREYVVNAKTTRDLGLNNQGGVFVQMANELMLLRQEVADLKAQDRQIGVQLIKQTRTTATTLDKWDSVGMPA